LTSGQHADAHKAALVLSPGVCHKVQGEAGAYISADSDVRAWKFAGRRASVDYDWVVNLIGDKQMGPVDGL